MADLWVYSLGADWVDSYRSRIRAVTRAEAAQAAARFCFPQPAAVVLVGPGEALARAAEGLGPVRVVPASEVL